MGRNENAPNASTLKIALFRFVPNLLDKGNIVLHNLLVALTLL